MILNCLLTDPNQRPSAQQSLSLYIFKDEEK